MLETIAIAALVLGGVSTAAVVTDDNAVTAEDKQPMVAEVRITDAQTPERDGAENPFLD
jgi:hypothetical protein